MSEPKPVWNIEGDQIDVHTIEYNGERVSGVRAIHLSADVRGTPEILLVVNPHRFNLRGEFNVKIGAAPFCPDCKHELRKLIIGKATGTPRYTHMGCICKVKE